MSSPRLSNRSRKYNDQLWSTYITGSCSINNGTLYCADKNIPYATYKEVEQLTEQYIYKQKACNNSDLGNCLLQIHNNKNDVEKRLQVSDSTIASIKQHQYTLYIKQVNQQLLP